MKCYKTKESHWSGFPFFFFTKTRVSREPTDYFYCLQYHTTVVLLSLNSIIIESKAFPEPLRYSIIFIHKFIKRFRLRSIWFQAWVKRLVPLRSESVWIEMNEISWSCKFLNAHNQLTTFLTTSKSPYLSIFFIYIYIKVVNLWVTLKGGITRARTHTHTHGSTPP